MNAKSFISSGPLSRLQTSIIDLENSNLPIDYFTSVLPRAQYGDESAAPVGSSSSASTFKFSESDHKQGVLFGTTAYAPNDNLTKVNSAPTPTLS